MTYISTRYFIILSLGPILHGSLVSNRYGLLWLSFLVLQMKCSPVTQLIVSMMVPQIHRLMLTVCALYLYYYYYYYYISISALTLLVGQQEGHLAYKNCVGLLVVTI